MLKSAIKLPDHPSPKFPLLARHEESRCTVLFISNTEGIVVGVETQYVDTIGKHSDGEWNVTDDKWTILPSGSSITITAI